ncbi:mucin-5AC-like [Dendronephthya gigantea]|uniref:mucin-5AC-like n=1 Tax=Dendronephthya gigantea TaxID=151771 RepID=UPI00106CAF59|nr:mucin-5AC-like [Dendronephthya gigantea]
MIRVLTMWKLAKVLCVLSILLCSTEGNVVGKDVSNSKDISTKCYFCIGEKKDGNNIELCSTDNDLEIEECELEDHFDKCIVIQAFSLSKNTTIFKRECSSRRFCEERKICADPDYSDCRYECCTGDLCNDFDFAADVSPTVSQPTVGLTRETFQDQDVQSRDSVRSTVAAVLTAQARESNQEKAQEIEPVVEEACEDLDTFCPTYVDDPSHWPMFCKDNDRYTSIACRKTCKFCVSSHEVTTIPTQQTTEITTTSSAGLNSKDCKNHRSDCKELGILEYCRKMPIFMKENCPETCGLCSKETTTTKVVKPLESGTEEVITSEPVATKPARVITTASENTERITTPRPSPISSDRVQSGISVESTVENEECQDKRDNCQELKEINYCRLMRLFMSESCRKTCGFCYNETVATGNVVDNITTSQPVTEKITTSEPVTEKMTTLVEPVSENITATELVTEKITTSEPVTEKMTTLEPLAENLTTTEVVSEKINTPEPVTERITTSEPVTERITTPGPATENITTSELVTERITTPGPTTENITTSELVTERITTSGPATVKTTTSELVTERITTPGPATEKVTTSESATENVTSTQPETEKIATTKAMTEKINTSEPVTEKVTTLQPLTERITTSEPVTDNTTTSEPLPEKVTTLKQITSEKKKNLSTTVPVITLTPTTFERDQKTSEVVIKTSNTSSDTKKPTVTVKPTLENEECQDKRDNCENLKSMDYCRLMRFFMKENCRKTCQFCSNGQPSTLKSKTTEKSTSSQVISEKLTEPSPEPTSVLTSSDTSSVTSSDTAVTSSQPRTTEAITKSKTSTTTASTTTAKVSSESNVLPTFKQTTPDVNPTSDRNCFDKRKRCRLFAKLDDYCNYHRDFMEKNCPKSCGFCSQDVAGGPTSRNVIPSPVTTAETTQENTENITPSTIQTPPDGTSTPEEEITKTTPSTIITPPDGTSTPKEEITKTTPSIIITPSDGTSTPEKEIKSTLQTTEAPSTPTEPTETTAKTTTQLRATSKSSIIVVKDCVDKRKECAKFAAYPGYCDYSREFMLEHCAKSCGFCTEGGDSGRVSSTQKPMETSTLMRSTLETTSSIVTEEPTAEPSAKQTSTIKPSAEPTSALTPSSSSQEHEKYDVVLVVGARTPNASDSFVQQKKIIQNILENPKLNNVSSPIINYGLVAYTKEAQVKFRINSDVPMTILQSSLSLLTWQKDGSRVDKGIEKAMELFESRPERKKRIVVFIDSPSDASYSELNEAAQEAEKRGIKLVVVAMGQKYDAGEFLIMAPRYQDRVLFDGTPPSNVTSRIKKAADETIAAIMQEYEETKNQGEGQAGVPVVEDLGPFNPESAEFGDKLRWKIWPWSECVNGKQSRVVRCYHFHEEKDYHVTIKACIKYVAPMPEKKRNC